MVGEETVQLYIQDVVAKRVRLVRELKAFKKVTLEKDKSKKVDFTIPLSKFWKARKSKNILAPHYF